MHLMREFNSGGGVELNSIHLAQLQLHEERSGMFYMSQEDTTTTQIEYHYT